MRELTIKLYQYSELDEAAKAKARDWFREGDTFQAEMEPYETAAKILGITFGTQTVTLYGGKTRLESDIRWSGFSSQGDGASFVGTYEYAKGCAKAIRKEFGTDTTLHDIADRLTAIQSSVKGFRVRAGITQHGRYYHSHTMRLELYDVPDSVTEAAYSELESNLLDTMRGFAEWIYKGLNDEYDYTMSDEYVADAIEANEYEFCASGKRAIGC